MAAAAHGEVGLACVLRALGSEIERELCVSVGRYRCVFILRLSTVNLGHGEAALAASVQSAPSQAFYAEFHTTAAALKYIGSYTLYY